MIFVMNAIFAKPEKIICMALTEFSSCSKSIVFSIIPPLSGEPSLFVFFQSIVRSIIEFKGINYNHVIIFSQAEF